MRSHSRAQLSRRWSRWAARTRTRAKRERKPGVRSFAPSDGVPMLSTQLEGQCPDRLRMVLWQGGPAQTQLLGYAPVTPVGWRGQRRASGRPHRDTAGHTHHVAQAQLAQSLTKRGVHAVASVGQNTVRWRALAHQVLDLLQRNLRLGRELQRLGHAGLVASRRSSAQSLGRYSCQAAGTLAAAHANDTLTATWQLSCLPSIPQY